MYNNYLENISDYGIAVRQGAHAKFENNHFESVQIPITTDKFDGPDGYVCLAGNIYSGACSAASNSITQTDCDFWNDLPYDYSLDSAHHVAMIVKLFAGAGVLDTIKAADPDTNEIPTGNNKLAMAALNPGFDVSLPYPNPVHDMFNIDLIIAESGEVDIKITDIYGRCMESILSISLLKGKNTIRLKRDGLNPGLYIYTFEFQESRILRKVIFTD
jgi:hypothetical protein